MNREETPRQNDIQEQVRVGRAEAKAEGVIVSE